MMTTMMTTPSHRNLRSLSGAFVAILGIATALFGISPGSVGADLPTQTVPLHNASAGPGPCPDSVNSYWHFVTAPNNASFSFVSITLDLNGTSFTFSGSQIIPNGIQTDNVFVAVPTGHAITDIVQATSFANISPDTGDVSFVLSHVCAGTGSTTTTTTSTTEPESTTTTSTTEPESTTTTTSTTEPETTTTTTTLAPTTTLALGDASPTTTTTTTTTTTLAASAGPTTTTTTTTTTLAIASAGATTTLVSAAGPDPAIAELPRTGSGSSGPLVLLGAVLVLLGGVMLLGTRRLPTD
jgi:LPXTG-motif cell wall-anchored protein